MPSVMNSIKHYLRIIGFVILLTGIISPAYGDQMAPSNTNTSIRKFDKNRLNQNRNNPKYQYHRDKPEPPRRRSKPRKYRKVRQARPVHFDTPRADFSGLAKGIMVVLIIGLVVFLLLQLMKVNFKGLLKKKSDKAKVVTVAPLKEVDEIDINNMEFEDLVQQAIDKGQFRTAVRLLYLRTLRLLSDQSLISWKHEKTNHQYLRELSDVSLKPLFSDVTLIFEYAWYGEVPVDKDEFNQARASFMKFEQTLRQNYAV